MSSEDEQIQQRRANLAKLSELGVNSYPHRFDRTATITDLVRAHGEKTGPELEATRIDTTTSGRILGIRNFGKANFLVLSDGRSRIQVYIKKDSLSERDFEVFRLLDFGDVIGVEGHLFRTRTNELTIWASRIEFLAKCHLPLPEKWHGLTDIEIRYRQRYLDLIVNPEAREVFQVRSKVARGDAGVSRQPRISRSRDADDAADCRRRDGAPVPHASQRARHRSVSADRARALPEAARRGRPRARLRDQPQFPERGISTRHNPEFTMLEFYQAYSDYQDLMTMTEELIAFVAMSATGKDEIQFDGETISLRAPFARVSLRQAAADAASKKLGQPVAESDLRDHAKVSDLAARLGVSVDPKFGPGKITTTIFETLVEESLVQPTFVYDFPTEVSPLSKQRPGDPDTVERFELYIGKMEIANAFSELNDPVEQRNRFEQQLEERAKGDQEAHAMDEDYVRALEYGLPPTAGEGVGVDRLVMLLTDSRSIRDVILFPHMRPK